MGHLYADDLKDPQSVMAILGDFSFFAGKPNAELVSFKPDWCEKKFMIMTAREGEWLDHGLYPSWDAQNLWSVALAEKLGYHFEHAYTAYEITDYC